MPRYRRRRGYHRRAPFSSWGSLLTLLLGLALFFQWWFAALLTGATLIFYWWAVLPAKCCVQTRAGRPCSNTVRGIMATCEYHPGAKRGFPILLNNGPLSLPVLMWRNPRHAPVRQHIVNVEFTEMHAEAPESAAQISRAKSLNTTMAWLTGIGVAIALASFVRDMVAG